MQSGKNRSLWNQSSFIKLRTSMSVVTFGTVQANNFKTVLRRLNWNLYYKVLNPLEQNL